MFIVEQAGRIYRISKEGERWEKTLYLDIRGRVDDQGNEEGLLGLAFHPRFQENGTFFVNYTASRPDQTRITRFERSQRNPSEADPSTEEILLTYDQPYRNHNGGGLAFGPDGFLYIGVGDGGSGGDPRGHGQNLRTLLGTILRIDVDRTMRGQAYGIPDGNPFAGQSQARSEIFAYGLRNPWRISFDPLTGTLWTGDVGQNAYEEIDTIVAGGNYGWNVREGMHCFQDDACEQVGMIDPVWEYDRDGGFSITGGYVYRGQELPALQGKYIYGDYVSTRIWALDFRRPGGPENTLLAQDRKLRVSSFGTDAQGEIYLCSFDGKIYKLQKMQ